jgi:hypothetical protein
VGWCLTCEPSCVCTLTGLSTPTYLLLGLVGNEDDAESS